MSFHNRTDTAPDGNFRLAGAEKSLGPESSLQTLPVDHHVTLLASCRKAYSKYKPLGNVLTQGHFYITCRIEAFFVSLLLHLTAHALAISETLVHLSTGMVCCSRKGLLSG